MSFTSSLSEYFKEQLSKCYLINYSSSLSFLKLRSCLGPHFHLIFCSILSDWDLSHNVWKFLKLSDSEEAEIFLTYFHSSDVHCCRTCTASHFEGRRSWIRSYSASFELYFLDILKCPPRVFYLSFMILRPLSSIFLQILAMTLHV